MTFHLDFDDSLEKKTLSEAYTEVMDEILAADDAVISMDADLMHAVGVQNIKDKYPGRVMDVGIAEENMVGMGAGLAYAGKKPFLHTFAAFATRRTFDQIFISCAYGKNNIKIYGSDPGITASFNGGTHMPFEDVGLMRTVPQAVVIDIVDNTMMKDVVRKIKDMDGVIYFRAGRSNAVKVYHETSEFEIGKGNVLKDGSDVAIITSGIMVSESLKAAKELESKGISAAVIDMFTIKPIDGELLVQYAKKTGAVVTTDNHNENGGLGDAVASVLCERCPTPLRKVAIKDEFGEVGPYDYLKERFNLNASGVVQAAEDVLKMK